MRRPHVVYRFGTFELDPASRRLTRGTGRVRLTESQAAVLLHLASNAPQVVSMDALAKAGWGAAATDNSVQQAISQLRKTLGQHNGADVIETVPNSGYRFVAPIERLEAHDAPVASDRDEEPYRSCVEGQRELATLKRDGIEKARRAFERALQHSPDHLPAHIGLANAHALAFEATRVDAACTVQSLPEALEHARRATAIAPREADAWSTLGFAQSLNGDVDAAIVSASRAVALDPVGWPHWLRLAFVSWGEDRIDAAQKALSLCPTLVLAHWLIGTVFVARGAFSAALTHLHAACMAQDKDVVLSSTAYPAVGLHLLHGLVLAAQERLDEAVHEFRSELGGPDRGQIYSRECSANTWYALGAVYLRRGQVGEATAAFRRALEVAPGHFLSMAALGLPAPPLAPTDPRLLDAAIARSIALTRAGRHRDASEVYRDAVLSARAPHAGWILPVEPIIHAAARPDIWSDTLTIVQKRAT